MSILYWNTLPEIREERTRSLWVFAFSEQIVFKLLLYLGVLSSVSNLFYPMVEDYCMLGQCLAANNKNKHSEDEKNLGLSPTLVFCGCKKNK